MRMMIMTMMRMRMRMISFLLMMTMITQCSAVGDLREFCGYVLPQPG